MIFSLTRLFFLLSNVTEENMSTKRNILDIYREPSGPSRPPKRSAQDAASSRSRDIYRKEHYLTYVASFPRRNLRV